MSSAYTKHLATTDPFGDQGQRGGLSHFIKGPTNHVIPPTRVNIDARPDTRHVTCDPYGAHDEIEVVVDAKFRISPRFYDILCSPYIFTTYY
jgi:hypothetical protein